MLCAACPRVPDLWKTELPLHRFTLRFKNGQSETGFLNFRKASLHRRTKLITLVAGFMNMGSLFFCTVVGQWHVRATFTTDAAYQIHLRTLFCAAASAVLLLFFAAAMFCNCIADRVTPLMMEVATIGFMTAYMAIIVISSPANVSALMGENFKDVHGYASDSGILMTIDGIVTAAHLGLPTRWYIMMPMEVVAILLYASIIFVIGSQEPVINASFNFIFLSGLVIATSVGKRYAELMDRQAFMSIIHEKSARCEAEFRLSQAAEKKPEQRRPHDLASESVAETSPNSEVLKTVRESDGEDMAAKLARVVEVAKTEHWYINTESLHLVPNQVLGSGAFGVVVEGIVGGMLVAVKLSKELVQTTTEKELGNICNECRIFRHLRHPNIVSFHGAVIEPDHRRICLVIERIRGIVLRDFIKKKLTECSSPSSPSVVSEQYQILIGVGRALLHLHTRDPHIVHSDLKSSNVMVEVFGDEVQAKLLDFGLSRVLTRGSRRPLGGTRSWMAPEVFNGTGDAKCSADIYSLGHLIVFVATGVLPPTVHRDHGRRRRVVEPHTPLLPTWPVGCVFEPCCKQLVDACLRFDEAERPSIMDVYHEILGMSDQLDMAETSRFFLRDVRRIATRSFRPPELPAEGNGEEPAQPTPERWDHLAPLPEAEAEAEALSPQSRTFSPQSRTLSTPMMTKWKRVHTQPCTSPDSMQVSLLGTLARWNFEKSKPPCCELHAVAKLAREVLASIAANGCIERPLPYGTSHCPHCGILDRELHDGVCNICGLQGLIQTSSDVTSCPAASHVAL